MTNPSSPSPDLNDRRTRLKQKMAEAREELVSTLKSLTPEQFNLPTRNEGWSVREVAAHIASAEGGMEPILHRILNREPNQRETAGDFDLERYNNSRIRKRNDKTIEGLLEELQVSRDRILPILDRLTEEDLDTSGYHPVAGDINLYGLFVVIYRHERTHTADIQQALSAAQNSA